LKYIIFDEVHIPEVSNNILWANLIPHDAQYILLSATINNIEDLIKNINLLSPKKINVIEYNIRPIPLQRLLFKGFTDPEMRPESGLISANLRNKKRLSCIINMNDLTNRDIIYLNNKYKVIKSELTIEKLDKLDRELQYEIGQKIANSKIIKDNIDKINEEILQDIDQANIDCIQSNMYNLLSYLFSNDMQPVLVYNTNPNNIYIMINNLIKYINYLESNDPEYISIEKKINSLNKSDNKDKTQTAELLHGKYCKKNTKIELETHKDSIETIIDYSVLNKWKFSNSIDELETNEKFVNLLMKKYIDWL
jgi:hypothetical protein